MRGVVRPCPIATGRPHDRATASWSRVSEHEARAVGRLVDTERLRRVHSHRTGDVCGPVVRNEQVIVRSITEPDDGFRRRRGGCGHRDDPLVIHVLRCCRPDGRRLGRGWRLGISSRSISGTRAACNDQRNGTKCKQRTLVIQRAHRSRSIAHPPRRSDLSRLGPAT